MSKQSRRRNRLLAAMVGLTAASKLGVFDKAMGSSDVYDKAQKARKAFKSTVTALPKNKVTVGSTILTPRTKSGQIAMFEKYGKKMPITVPKTKLKRSTRIGFTNRNMGGDVGIKTKLNGITKTKTY